MTVAAFLPDAIHPAGRPSSFVEILRPFLLLAVLAFLAGFGGYLILGPPNVMNLTPAAQTTAAVASPAIQASAPAATGDWNAPKQI